MIEDDVEDDFESRAMERLDHVPEFVEDPERFLPRTVRMMRREEGDGLVAPVIHLASRRIVRVELKHRQQLDRGDPQVFEIRNLLDQSGVCPSRRGPDA